MKDLLKSVGQEYLLDSVSTLKGIGPKSSKTLSQASIESVLDLLLLLPRKYKRRDRWFKVDKRLLPRTVTIEVLICIYSQLNCIVFIHQNKRRNITNDQALTT